jgi:hypothetical protein
MFLNIVASKPFWGHNLYISPVLYIKMIFIRILIFQIINTISEKINSINFNF